MKKLLHRILKTETIKDSVASFFGTFLTGILGVVFGVIVARHLGKSSYGIFSVSVLVLTMVADIANVGTDTGIIRFVGKYFSSDKNKALKFLKLALKTKVVASVLIILLGWFLIPLVANNFFQKPEFVSPLRIALFGSASILLFSFSTSSIQALQKFWSWTILTTSMNAVRLLVVIVFISLGMLTVNSTVGIYALIPLVGFFIALFLIPNFLTVKKENEVATEFFQYNKWVAIFTLIAAISARMDSFVSTRFLSLEDIGVYSVAVTLASIMTQVVGALGAVVAPKLASFNTNEVAFKFLKKLQFLVLGISAAVLIIGIPLSFILIPAIYGEGYLASVLPFIVLLTSQVIFLCSIPVHMATFYYFSYPKLFVWVSLIHLVLIAGIGWILIPIYGYMGAAYTVLIGNISNLVIPGAWVLNKFKKKS